METKYLYFKIELSDSPTDWDESICKSLDEVREVLGSLEVYFDDPDYNIKATVSGIGMTEQQYQNYLDSLPED